VAGAVGQIVQVAGTYSDSFAVDSSGQLYGFGGNYHGQLGNETRNNTTEPTPTPTLVALPGGTTIDTVARGSQAGHTLVLVADLAVASGSLPMGAAESPYGTQLQLSGGTSPYTWGAAGLPPGLSINS